MNTEKTKHTCQYCKEKIKADALKCKHCHSRLPVTTPSHEGTCPICKEEILPEAIKCKHCKSSLSASTTETGCNCDEKKELETAVIKAMARLNVGGFGFGPDPIYRDCQNNCSIKFLNCNSKAFTEENRKHCLNFLNTCSMMCDVQSKTNFG